MNHDFGDDLAVLIQAMWLATTPSRALHTCAARAHNIAGIRAVREAARSVPPVAIGTASHSDRCANRDFRLAVFVVCVQVWLVASSTLRLRAPGKTPGSVAHGDLVREAARGVPQVAISPLCPGGPMVLRAQIATFAVLCSSQADRRA